MISVEANAATKKSKKKSTKHTVSSISLPPQTSLVVDINQGKVLHAENADLRIYPASLTKVMTLYLTFEAIKNGKLSFDKNIKVSSHAASMRPSKLGLKPGETLSVRDAVMSLIIKSANDSAVTLAESISGSSESKFAKLMTKRAHDLGMKSTTFRNASGWHDPEQKTTAIDLAKLAMALKRDFPEYYHLFAENSFTFRGHTYYTHNRVARDYKWADGLKTGFTNPAGFNLITTASKDGKNIVGVVTGGRSGKERDLKMVALLDKHLGVQTATVIKHPTKAKIQLAKAKAPTYKRNGKRKSRRMSA
ncbi:MAG: D-alanyl-D-alanine carboxypeptidase [Rickettsiaceae bacterium]|nr:D-alanyl-D-alanine carboxypeptidase [Rickettsiaceae bacterium]